MDVFTVSQITRHIKRLLAQDDLLMDVWISGEVSNLLVSQSGHAYFTLKDPQSQLRCVMFSRGTGMDLLADGTAITAHGYVSIYEVRGSLDFVTDIVMAEGVGPLALEFERLKAALNSEGLFDPSRKRELPRFPKFIGLVTSPSGAVLHDILQVLKRRYPLVEVLLAPSLVQGPEAVPGLANALRLLIDDGRSDLIILARGGGSLEELWPFNQESVARAIYASPIPVVSAVGHETNYTIADFVSDVRAPTPSAAAEMATPDTTALRMEVSALAQQLCSIISDRITNKGHGLSNLVSEFHHLAPDIVTLRRSVDDVSQRASVATSSSITLRVQEMNAVTTQLQTLNPKATLKRGYAVVQKEATGDVVFQKTNVIAGDPLRVTVSDGDFSVAVKGASKRKSKRELAKATARLFP